MSETRKNADWKMTALIAVSALLAALVLYAVSIGPVLYLDRTLMAGNTPQWIVVFYWPLLATAGQCTIAEHALELYLELWGVG